tara:strand:- start:1067 stop:1444 length:378 start_codon:yes stop_codon:yes gene_type:complete
MKIVLFYFQFLLLGTFFSGDLPYNEIAAAFEENDASSVISYCEDPVLLVVSGKEGIYNHAQASMVLMDFFRHHPSGDFKYEFQGKEEDDDIFSAATYVTETETLSIQLSFSTELSNKIQSIQIRN